MTIPQGPNGLGAPAGAAKLSFRLESVTLEGSSVYSGDTLSAEWASMIGQTVTVEEVFALAARLTARYRKDDYVLSRVIVPAQTIGSGKVVLRAVEGHISDVQFEGDGAPALLRDTQTKNLLASRPLTGDALERAMLLLNDTPGLTARGVLSPASSVSTGAAILTVKLEKKLLDLTATLDNRGSHAIGPIQATVGGALNNGLGLGERIGARIIGTPQRELRAGQVDTQWLVTGEGTIVRGTLYAGRTWPGARAAAYDITGETLNWSVVASHPLMRSRDRSIWLDGTFSGSSTDSDLLGRPNGNDQVRAMRLGTRFELLDGFSGTWNGYVEGSHGLNALGASTAGLSTRSRAAASFDFFKGNAEIGREQQIGAGFSLYTGGAGQWSDSPLPSAEQFGLGGSRYGRSFDPSVILGDSGFAGLTELRYTTSPGWTGVNAIQLYAFGDAGRTYLRSAAIGQPGSSDVADIGLGIRVWGIAGLSGSIEVAKPLVKDPTKTSDKRDPRVFFALRMDW